MASRFKARRDTRVGTATSETRGATETRVNAYDFNKASYAFFTRLGLTPLSHRLARGFDRATTGNANPEM